MRAYSKAWTAAVVAGTVILAIAALILRRTFALIALSDWIQCLLLLSGTLAFIPNAMRSRGRLRVFWSFLATGVAFWLGYQLLWTYYEVWLRQDVPAMCAGDIVLFLHIVPFMAALALRPYAPQDAYSTRLRSLDFALMMVWWVYLYIFTVTAWQYVVANVNAYGDNLNLLYLVEKLAFLAALFAGWWRSKNGWKILYANLFGASLTYAASSYIANWAIARDVYYSGSLYDIPLVASIGWLTPIGLWSREEEPETQRRSSSATYGIWLARLAMITVFSLPLFAAFAVLEPGVPARIRSFRLLLTLVAALVMGVMVFVRQSFLDGELRRLLHQSQESFANLKLLQAQITESEKHASIGQLVGGAAHELNNPIAAMLGYSDLLMNTSLTPDQQGMAEKIGQQVRRTRSLVASLLSFAKQGPAALVPVDLNAILRTSIKLSEPIWQSLKIELIIELDPGMPTILGDSNQLLQVFVQIVTNALHCADQMGCRSLTLKCGPRERVAYIELVDTAIDSSPRSLPADASQKVFSAMGLNACRNILQQHNGEISWQQGEGGGIKISVELPLIPRPQTSFPSGSPAMWQAQPFA